MLKNGTINKNTLAIVILFSILALLSAGCASAATHYVNPGESIQVAVDTAAPGDTIIIRDGIYTDNINVDKRLTIMQRLSRLQIRRIMFSR